MGRKSYLLEDANAGDYSVSPMSFFSIVAPLTVASVVGNVSIYGPPVIAADGTVTTAPTAAGSLRGGHRLAIYRLTGGTGVGGTFTSAIFTFNTTRDVATPVIIGRAAKVVGLGTAGFWSVEAASMITPFQPSGLPLAIAEPGYGIQIRCTDCGSDGTILMEALCRLVPTSVPTPA